MDLREINLGTISPQLVPTVYELSRHYPWDDLTVVRYRPQEGLMIFGNYFPEIYLDLVKVDIPLVRAASSAGNPYYMNEGLIMLDFNHNQDMNIFHFNEAMKKVFKDMHGIDLYSIEFGGDKLFWKDGDKDVKLSSPQDAEGHIWTYVNWDCDYNKHEEYLIADVPYRTKDRNAYGIKKILPNIDIEVTIDAVLTDIALQLTLQLTQKGLTTDEQTKIDQILPVHSSADWTLRYERSDVRWFYPPQDDGLEIEIELSEKPVTNIVEFEIDSKGLQFTKQILPDNPKDRAFIFMPVNCVGAYVITHKTKRNNEYKAGIHSIIYRPIVSDADGREAWCDMEWNADKSAFDITVPQHCIDDWTYPLIIDPTIGYTVIGSSFAFPFDSIRGNFFEEAFTDIDLFIQSIFLSGSWVQGTDWSSAYYAKKRNDDAENAVKIQNSEGMQQQIMNMGAAAPFKAHTLVKTNLTEQPVIPTDKDDHSFGIVCDTSSIYNQIRFDIVTGERSYDKAFTYNRTLPDPLGTVVELADVAYSIFMEYGQNQRMYYWNNNTSAINFPVDAANVFDGDLDTFGGINGAYGVIQHLTDMAMPLLQPKEIRFITKVEIRARIAFVANSTSTLRPIFDGVNGDTFTITEVQHGTSSFHNWIDITNSANSPFAGGTALWDDLLNLSIRYAGGVNPNTIRVFFVQTRITFEPFPTGAFDPTHPVKKKTGDFSATHKTHKKTGDFSATHKVKAKTGIITQTHRIKAKTGVFSPTQKAKKKTGGMTPTNKFRKKT